MSNSSKTCVSYECPNSIEEVKNTIAFECPEEFIRDCSTNTEEINFINSKNFNDLEYKKGIFWYVSGCGDVVNGGFSCMQNKVKQLYTKVKNMKSYYLEAGKECCHDPSAPANDDVAPPSDKNAPAEEPPDNGNSASNPNAPAVAAETTTSNSNNQNVTSNLLELLELDGCFLLLLGFIKNKQ
uniref:Uncharacterized protein n=1 Tax=Panagrolaimus davidi TaxID=227884 RepID=A0A914P2L6_9BILA